MSINEVSTEKLKKILKEKNKKLNEFYLSDNYEWYSENKEMRRYMYNSFIKYKIDFYRFLKIQAFESKLKAEIETIERELDFRNTHAYKLNKK